MRIKGEVIVRWAKMCGRPTNSYGAYRVWQELSSESGGWCREYARRVYVAAGYVPYCGYPLVRNGDRNG